MDATYRLSKQVLDKTVAALLVILLSPVVALVLWGMAADMLVVSADRGSFLHREQRVSRGRVFNLLKFRSLRAKALARAGGHAGPLEHDASNLTWAGRTLLKPWYLDELPQLLNVLRGDISLVGPRPWPPEMVQRQLEAGRDYRNRVIAGLTGAAQVTKGEGTNYEDLDLHYIERAESLGSWALVRYDLEILRRTFAVIARRQGLSY